MPFFIDTVEACNGYIGLKWVSYSSSGVLFSVHYLIVYVWFYCGLRFTLNQIPRLIPNFCWWAIHGDGMLDLYDGVGICVLFQSAEVWFNRLYQLTIDLYQYYSIFYLISNLVPISTYSMADCNDNY